VANLADVLEARFGVRTEARASAVGFNVDIARTSVLRNDPARLAAVIVNLSAVAVFLAPDPLVSATHGIRLAANGGSLILTWDTDFDVTAWEWFGVADADNADVYTLEVIAR